MNIVASFKFSPRRTFEEDEEDGPNLRRTQGGRTKFEEDVRRTDQI